jgi:hypothetical protein
MIVWNGNNYCPTVEEMLSIVQKYPGKTLKELHDLKYILIATPLFELVDRELIFIDKERFYPNN